MNWILAVTTTLILALLPFVVFEDHYLSVPFAVILNYFCVPNEI